MKEKLEEIKSKIVSLEKELDSLRNLRDDIKSKLCTPDIKGKYIHCLDDSLYDYYMRVDEVTKSKCHLSDFEAYGPSITIVRFIIGDKYLLNSYDVFGLENKYEIITKERFDEVLNQAIKKFNT